MVVVKAGKDLKLCLFELHRRQKLYLLPFDRVYLLRFDNIDQEMIVKEVIDMIMGAIVNNEVKQILDNDLDDSIDRDTSQENKGIDGNIADMVTGVADSIGKVAGAGILGAIMVYACPFIVLICCCFLCTNLFKGIGSRNSQQTRVSETKFGKNTKKVKKILRMLR